MFQIRHSEKCLSERQYILEVVLKDFLGIEYTAKVADVDHLEIGYGDSKLVVADDFFRKADDAWLTKDSLPSQPLANWSSSDLNLDLARFFDNLPVIYGKPVVALRENLVEIGIDLFGAAFFMLSRYEEAITTERDRHDRFPGYASIAFREGFLDRPIVNEYVELLWACIRYLWPNVVRKSQDFQLEITCDVDQPYKLGTKKISFLCRQVVGDLVLRRRVKSAVESISNFWRAKHGEYSRDPFYRRLYWMMDVNESRGNQMAFYFIPSITNRKYDGHYLMDEPVIEGLLKNIKHRGHLVGIHPSYESFGDVEQLRREKRELETALAGQGLPIHEIGGRQHYLRWDSLRSPRTWEDAGLSYDSTLGFADQIGFRCGTCFEFPLYDLVGRSGLRVRERPLMFMETTLFSKEYMGLDYSDETLRKMLDIKAACKKHRGRFVALWHNSSFDSPMDVESYAALIE